MATSWRALTRELDDVSSPVRQFLAIRFTTGLRDVQRRYRDAAPELLVRPADGGNPGTIGAAADWLLRFLVHPEPDLDLVGAACARAGALGVRIPRAALDGVLAATGMKMPIGPSAMARTFTGPCAGSLAEPSQLNRICWVLALITEAYRAGPAVLNGPLGRFAGRMPTSSELLELIPPAGLEQLSSFRQVYERMLLPALRGRRGLWSSGPVFEGSALIGGADADLIAAGLLLDVKTERAKPSLGIISLFQVIGYFLLDFSDEFGITDLGLFQARYGYLAIWDAAQLLGELAGHAVDPVALRAEFRDLLNS